MKDIGFSGQLHNFVFGKENNLSEDAYLHLLSVYKVKHEGKGLFFDWKKQTPYHMVSVLNSFSNSKQWKQVNIIYINLPANLCIRIRMWIANDF